MSTWPPWNDGSPIPERPKVIPDGYEILTDIPPPALQSPLRIDEELEKLEDESQD